MQVTRSVKLELDEAEARALVDVLGKVLDHDDFDLNRLTDLVEPHDWFYALRSEIERMIPIG